MKASVSFSTESMLDGLLLDVDVLGDGFEELQRRLFAAAQALRNKIGSPLPPTDFKAFRQQISVLHNKLSEESFATYWEAGETMTDESVIAYALSGKDT